MPKLLLPRRMFFRFLVLAGACLFWGPLGLLNGPVQAGVGSTTSKRAHDLMVTIDFRWAGTQQGGYYPIRIRVSNAGPTCELTFRFTPFDGQQLPIVERRDLQVEQDGTAEFTLSIPMVGRGSVGELKIERDGAVLDQLTTQIRLSEVDYNPSRPSVLVITSGEVPTGTMEHGIKAAFGGGEMPFPDNHQVLAPILLPNLWIDYTGVDIVMIPLKTLARLESDKRSAILQWTQTGGTLVIYEVGTQPDSSQELLKLLDLPDSAHWIPADTQRWTLAADRFVDDNEHPTTGFGGPEDVVRNANGRSESQWGVTSDAFAGCDYLLGRVYAFPKNPFPGTPEDWAWWLSNTPPETKSWEFRSGVLPRRANLDFFNFLIPGVTSVPVYAFLVLMTLFTIVIGPLNYIFLRRRKRTYLLLLTIPAIAFVTSLTLFIYSTLSYGFSVTSRTRSVTVLDQRTNTAVSLSRISLFAGLAPSDGLKFSPATAVYPIWPATKFDGGSGFESGRAVWGEQQELSEGWLRSRTRTQFATIQHRTERGRLEIGANSGSKLSVSNGLEWDIKALVLVDDAGHIYIGDALAAGNSGELAQVAGDLGQLGSLVNLLREYPLELPDDLAMEKHPSIPRPSVGPYRNRYRYRGSPYELESGGTMESLIQQFKTINTLETPRQLQQIIPRRSYLAVLADRPGIELGLEDTDERAGYHVLLGHY